MRSGHGRASLCLPSSIFRAGRHGRAKGRRGRLRGPSGFVFSAYEAGEATQVHCRGGLALVYGVGGLCGSNRRRSAARSRGVGHKRSDMRDYQSCHFCNYGQQSPENVQL